MVIQNITLNSIEIKSLNFLCVAFGFLYLVFINDDIINTNIPPKAKTRKMKKNIPTGKLDAGVRFSISIRVYQSLSVDEAYSSSVEVFTSVRIILPLILESIISC